MYFLRVTELLDIKIDLFDSFDCEIVTIILWILGLVSHIFVELLGLADLCADCSLRRFGWSIRGIQLLARCLV